MKVVCMNFALILLARTQSHDHNLTSREVGKWGVPVYPREEMGLVSLLLALADGDGFKGMWEILEELEN